MFGGGKKKEEKPKVVTIKADPKQAKRMRDAALEAARRRGIEVKETKAGVGRPAKESPKQERERRNREAINNHAKKGTIDYPTGKRGSKSEWA